MKDFELLRAPQIRAIAREERLRLLNLLTREAITVSDAARKLDLPANRAHYHVQQLVQHGLVEVVGTGRKRRHLERFYRSVARNFLMDPELAFRDGETSAALVRSAEAAFLDWRRKEILDIDLAETARAVVGTCLRVKPEETVLVMFGPQGMGFAEACLVEIEAVGARARPKIWSRNVLFQTLDRHSPRALERHPFLDPELDDALDAVLFVSTHMPQGAPPNESQRTKLPVVLETVSRWQQGLRERRVRHLEVDLPHRGDFQIEGVTPEDAIAVYWRGIRGDHSELVARSHRILDAIGTTRTLHFSCPQGTDLTVDVDVARAAINDGVISDADLERGRNFDVLPAGSVSVLPAADTATGVWRADYTLVGGRHLRNLELELRGGRVHDVRGDSGAEMIRGAMRQAAGEADRLAVITFGVNPAGSALTGMPVLDGCLDGIVTLGFGNNELLGGDVRSTLDLGFPSRSVTTEADGTRVTPDASRSSIQ